MKTLTRNISFAAGILLLSAGSACTSFKPFNTSLVVGIFCVALFCLAVFGALMAIFSGDDEKRMYAAGIALISLVVALALLA